ncbi:unnamed protein product [Paramecium sonneborni]|uniref:Transmembrane protein n=1 Tax=Paramecium sonneborni TaxID=65129 RepID=A0A8S1K7G3_9CILI|nr:unnamed protein product [Paramecium sonneborni]
MFRKRRNDPLNQVAKILIIDYFLIILLNLNVRLYQIKNNQKDSSLISKSGQKNTLRASCCILDCHFQGSEQENYQKKALDLNFKQVFNANNQANQNIIEYFTGKVDIRIIQIQISSHLYIRINKSKIRMILNRQPLNDKEFNLKVFDEILRFEKSITTRNRFFRVQDRILNDNLKTAQKNFWVNMLEWQVMKIQDVNKAKQLSSTKLSYSVLNEFIKSQEKTMNEEKIVQEMFNQFQIKDNIQYQTLFLNLDPNGLKFTNKVVEINRSGIIVFNIGIVKIKYSNKLEKSGCCIFKRLEIIIKSLKKKKLKT